MWNEGLGDNSVNSFKGKRVFPYREGKTNKEGNTILDYAGQTLQTKVGCTSFNNTLFLCAMDNLYPMFLSKNSVSNISFTASV